MREGVDTPADPAAWEEAVQVSRFHTIVQAQLHGGPLAVRDRAELQTYEFEADSGAALLLHNGGRVGSLGTFLLKPGSRVVASGAGNNRLNADDALVTEGAAFEFRLGHQTSADTPLLTLAANATGWQAARQTCSATLDVGVNALNPGTYFLMEVTGTGFVNEADAWTYSIDGLSGDDYAFFWNEEMTELWLDLKTPWQKELGGNAAMLGAVSSHTSWATARSVRDFSDNRHGRTARLPWGEKGRGSLWFDALGDFRRQSGKKCAPGYDFDAWGGAFGIEYAVEPHVFVGGGLGSLFGVNRASEGFSRIRQNLVMGGAYTGLRLLEKKNDAVWFHASGSFGGSRNSGHSTALDGSGRLAADWTENAWAVDLRAVWSRRLTGRCSLYAFSGVRYTHARHNDFHASGGVDRLCVVGKELASVELHVGVGLAHDRGSWSFMEMWPPYPTRGVAIPPPPFVIRSAETAPSRPSIPGGARWRPMRVQPGKRVVTANFAPPAASKPAAILPGARCAPA